MTDHDHSEPMSAFEAFGTWLRTDPLFEQAKARLWAMSAQERVQAMRAGRLSLALCLHWASRRPREVPLLNGEWEFIAINTPEVADTPDTTSQRERVTASLLRCPDHHDDTDPRG
jgi:hypothetical protein